MPEGLPPFVSCDAQCDDATRPVHRQSEADGIPDSLKHNSFHFVNGYIMYMCRYTCTMYIHEETHYQVRQQMIEDKTTFNMM